MRARRSGLAVLVVAILIGAPSATQAQEPNDSQLAAIGPLVAGQTYPGAIETENDEDWYVLYASGERQLDVTISVPAIQRRPGCFRCLTAELRSGSESLQSVSLDLGETEHLRYTVGPGEYFLRVEGAQGVPYQLRVDTAGGLASSECLTAIADGDRAESALARVRAALRRRASRAKRRRLQRELRRLEAERASAEGREAATCV